MRKISRCKWYSLRLWRTVVNCRFGFQESQIMLICELLDFIGFDIHEDRLSGVKLVDIKLGSNMG